MVKETTHSTVQCSRYNMPWWQKHRDAQHKYQQYSLTPYYLMLKTPSLIMNRNTMNLRLTSVSIRLNRLITTHNHGCQVTNSNYGTKRFLTSELPWILSHSSATSTICKVAFIHSLWAASKLDHYYEISQHKRQSAYDHFGLYGPQLPYVNANSVPL